MVYLLLFLLAGLIVARVIKIQIWEGAYWNDKANALTLRYANIDALRGNIFDVNGQLLATSIPYYDVAVDMNSDPITDKIFQENIDSLALCLTNLFGDRSKSQYKRELVNARVSGDRYHKLRNNVSYKELQQLREFPLFRKGRFKGGVIYIQKGKRELPFKFLASRTIGYNTGNSKPVGLEGAYDPQLTGVSGKRLVRKIAGGIEMPINDDNEIEPKDGCDIVSTIDINIQDVAQSSLLTQLKKHKAGWGTVILMEVKTGEIRAIANLSRNRLPNGQIDTVNYSEKYNYAIGYSTEPGSTFKLAALLAAMEDGYIDLDDTVNTGKGVYKFYNQKMKDTHEGGYGILTVQEVFEKSSNVGVSKLIYKHYAKNPQKFIDRLFKMGVNLSPELDIAGAGIPKIKTTKNKDWSGVSLPWMSIGYELALTPLQTLTFYNAIANEGAMMKPQFVKSIRKQGTVLKTFEPEVMHPHVVSALTIEKAKKMMEGVVQEGTAANLKNADYKIAGKTGTAQIAKGGSGYGNKNNNQTYQSSFVGYFPAENPKYSCIVVVNSPSSGEYYASAVAGPVFKEIADKVYSSLLEIHSEVKTTREVITKIPPIKNGSRQDVLTVCKELDISAITNSSSTEYVQVAAQKDSSAIVSDSKIDQLLEKKIMPDVSGMGLKDALYLLENAGLRVKVIGAGRISKQSIKAGAKFSNGSNLTLELS